MTTQQDYIAAVGDLVPGDLPLSESDISLAVDLALRAHSRHRPRTIVEDFDGDGGFDYAVSGFSDWAEGFSVIRTVEYPVDDDDQTPDMLQDDEWRVYEKPSGKVLRFLENKPTADEDFRVTYTAMHEFEATVATVEAYDEIAVQSLGAAFFCDMVATYFAQSGDSTIDADSVDHASRSREYAARAKAYRKIYFDHIGVKEGMTPAASVTRDQDKDASWGSAKLTHKPKYR